MSYQYDQYLARHRLNVKKGFDWISENLPELITESQNLGWQIGFSHDETKNKPDEYEAYDAYFYGGNRSYAVVQAYQKAWLLHIHRNQHHWQHWILINDDPEEGEILLDMPYNYILEMICDWWAFSWEKENLFEIFMWYKEHAKYMKLSYKTRKIVENILGKMMAKLNNDSTTEATILQHYGVKGMKWGVRRSPEELGHKKKVARATKHDNIITRAINSGQISKNINEDKQRRHTKSDHIPGRSYLNGNMDYAQALINKHSGAGVAIIDKNGKWTNKEKFDDSEIIGTHVDTNGIETKTNKGIISYSKTGTHVYPRKEK